MQLCHRPLLSNIYGKVCDKEWFMTLLRFIRGCSMRAHSMRRLSMMKRFTSGRSGSERSLRGHSVWDDSWGGRFTFQEKSFLEETFHEGMLFEGDIPWGDVLWGDVPWRDIPWGDDPRGDIWWGGVLLQLAAWTGHFWAWVNSRDCLLWWIPTVGTHTFSWRILCLPATSLIILPNPSAY